jgi:hypothetical protein
MLLLLQDLLYGMSTWTLFVFNLYVIHNTKGARGSEVG